MYDLPQRSAFKYIVFLHMCTIVAAADGFSAVECCLAPVEVEDSTWIY